MILHRAFIKEVLKTCAAVTTILISIFFVVRLVGFLRAASEGDIPLNSVLVLLVLKMITYMDIIFPLVLFISMLMVMGRWVRDNELTVISACGIGMKTFLKPMLILYCIMGSIVAIFSLYLSPLSSQAGALIEADFRTRDDTTGIIPGVFAETRSGSGVYFVEDFDQDENLLRNIFIYNNEEGDDVVILADYGFKSVDEKSNDDFLILKEGTQFRGNAGEIEYGAMDFETYAIRIKQSAKRLGTPFKARPTHELLKETHPGAVSEVQWRFSKIFSLFVLMLFALSFSSLTYRKARFPGLMNALLLYFAYSQIVGFMVALTRKGAVSPFASIWLVHFIFLLLACYLFYRRCQNKPLLPWKNN